MILDDKRLLALALRRGGGQDVAAETWLGDEGPWAEAAAASTRSGELPGLPAEVAGGHGFFLKHRRGAQGKGVQRAGTASGAWSLLASRSARGGGGDDWVIQRAVPPALSERGRKWCCRSHALVCCRQRGAVGEWAVAAYSHRAVVRLEHSAPYSPETADGAAHVQQAGGRSCPPPEVLAGSEPLAAAIHAATGRAMAAVQPELVEAVERAAGRAEAAAAARAEARAEAAAEASSDHRSPAPLVAHVLGLDWAPEGGERGGEPTCQMRKVRLLEMNAYPAIAAGTMAAVPVGLYTALVEDVLRLAVLPALEEVGTGRGDGRDCVLERLLGPVRERGGGEEAFVLGWERVL